MKDLRKKNKLQFPSNHEGRTAPEAFFFYEKRTGVSHFHVPADHTGNLPVDHAAGLLAMHCLVRGQTPEDYVVMVEAESRLLGGIVEKAENLLRAGRSVPTPVQLSRREQEVLDGVLRSLANKEIGSLLNVSERTVKFHVSSLLAKFKVRGRMELVRAASRGYLDPRPVSGAAVVDSSKATRESRGVAVPAPSALRKDRSAEIVSLPKRRLSA
ncbi:MAG: LuxR C-terminal-related transcriptional regulator [Acidobacteriia bacterium]|nr:LuxR C-terminal-related transcriptional regulator [Terriglobia bacterium]